MVLIHISATDPTDPAAIRRQLSLQRRRRSLKVNEMCTITGLLSARDAKKVDQDVHGDNHVPDAMNEPIDLTSPAASDDERVPARLLARKCSTDPGPPKDSSDDDESPARHAVRKSAPGTGPVKISTDWPETPHLPIDGPGAPPSVKYRRISYKRTRAGSAEEGSLPSSKMAYPRVVMPRSLPTTRQRRVPTKTRPSHSAIKSPSIPSDDSPAEASSISID